ncbi:hypothetical protein E2C01_074912 [Portunus trituberculatus]|uniref:Uncharacterized protein n=1 Tax=Portunus trituberculatus TaxID=210409 RepID=A0A5B7IIG6_PORTR|nr:hypothetical protein [Portunus trituberculatus]
MSAAPLHHWIANTTTQPRGKKAKEYGPQLSSRVSEMARRPVLCFDTVTATETVTQPWPAHMRGTTALDAVDRRAPFSTPVPPLHPLLSLCLPDLWNALFTVLTLTEL